MLTPTETDLQHLMAGYDPVKAHEYYELHKKLKGRQPGSGEQPAGFAKANAQRHEGAKAKQKRELAARIKSLSAKLSALEAKIREMEHKEASENRKSKAKKERSAKEKDKPKTAAEKAKAARDAEKYRDKHKQEIKTKAKEASNTSGGGSSSKDKKKSGSKSASLSDLKALATKVRGQIAVAKQKLAAL
jgi:hypothetical protein